MSKHNLSPTALGTFKNCPRCFWLEKVKGIKRPQGIFPSLPGGMDAVIKTYFDKFREIGSLPPEIASHVEGKLVSDKALMDDWRNWRKGLRYESDGLDVTLAGALDDCLISDGYYIPLDYKTRGWAPKEGGEAYYQHQLDCYCLLLEKNGYKQKGVAYLLYYYPKEVTERGQVTFNVEPHKIETDINAAEMLVREAVKRLNGPEPQASTDCEYCAWHQGQKL